jgi:predicted AlkP superfamily phosphohydrolase/phosphomutase
MPTSPSKIVVIGIDAASPALIRRWAEEGVLPHVRDLFARGLTGNTRSVDGFFVGSTWPSFYTGVTPARHGCHYLVQLTPGTYELYDMAENGIARYEPFWTRLSRAGRRVAVLDVPLTRLDPAVNGLQVVEWGTHDGVYGFRTSPPDAANEIRALFGAHPVGPSCDGQRASAHEYETLIQALCDGARVKGDLTAHFLRKGGWDFFMQVFSEAHCVGHQCWHLHDREHARHDARLAEQLGDPLRRVYESIDRSVGAIVRQAGDALVVVVIAHGMAHAYGANFLLRDLLCALGVCRAEVPPMAKAAPAVRLARRLWQHVPAGVRQPVARLRQAFLTAPRRSLAVDIDESFCFPHSNGQAVSGIRLNLMGREPRGRVAEQDATAFCDRLRQEILDIVDDRTGRPIARRVLRTRDWYAGEFLDDLPDLLVHWHDDAGTVTWPLSVRARSASIGIVEGVSGWTRTGEHRPEGMFVAVGPGLQRDALERSVSVLDFAPTFTGLLNAEVGDSDGEPIHELIRAASR